MKKEIQFSIIIPALDEEMYIEDAIKNAQKQDGGFNTEIIVVDNDSGDGTRRIAESLGVVVVEEPKRGVGRARRLGTEMAMGKFIVHIDADTRLLPNYLSEVKKRFDRDKKLVCVGGEFYFYDASFFWRTMRPILFPVFYLFARLTLGNEMGPMGNNMVFKKTAYHKTAGFDENLKYGEDFDLNRKLAKIGKVRLDRSLKFFISSRRYRLFQKDFWVYAANFFKFCIKKEIHVNDLSTHSKNS